ncbi:MAG: acyltransferase [Clostridia bacterium]|nr:acyltransferase [Clostridia bacterium]
MKKTSRIPELDGFRVILVFLVSWFHIWQQSWWTPYIGHTSLDFLVRSGYIHVDGTILLSGFLLFLPWARARRDGGLLPDTREFYQKRVCRIVPSYWFIITVVLFVVALPFGLYGSPQFMVQDLFTHYTFTFTMDRATYIQSPLGASYWTLAIELQMYLIFPFVARAAVKKPGAVLTMMTAAAWAWRGWCAWALHDYNMVLNQVPAFLDVYALGMALAMVYVKLEAAELDRKERILITCASTALLALCLWMIPTLLRHQAAAGDHVLIQRGQMIRRAPFALMLGGILIALPFTIRPIRWLMGNRVMTFLSSISMNYYLIHQTLCVHLRRLGIPASVSDMPNQAGEVPWKYQYTFLSFGLSVLAAVLVTYLVEKPAGKALQKWFNSRVCGVPVHQLKKLAEDARISSGDRVMLVGTDVPAQVMARAARLMKEAGCTVQVVMKDTRAELACGNTAQPAGIAVMKEQQGGRMVQAAALATGTKSAAKKE